MVLYSDKYDGYVYYYVWDYNDMMEYKRNKIRFNCGIFNDNSIPMMKKQLFIQKITNIANNYNIKIVEDKDRFYMMFE